MKTPIIGLVIALALAGGTAAAPAGDGRFGLGIILGDPTGISAKIPSGAQSINAILAYDLDGGPDFGPGCCDGGGFYAGADYVWYNYNLIRVTRGALPLYYGPGLNMSVWDAPEDNVRVGIRLAVGLEYQFAVAPFDIFLEIAPGINVIPNTRGYVMAGLGGRFFF